jgi:rRNA-processing protein FCF1
MPKRILVDTNILIDFSQGKRYARRFFAEAKEKYYEIILMEEVYAQTKLLSGSRFDRVKLLIEELKSQDIYKRIGTDDKEKDCSEQLVKVCFEVVGQDIGEVDRRIIAVAKLRNLILFSNDGNLKKVAKKEGINIL